MNKSIICIYIPEKYYSNGGSNKVIGFFRVGNYHACWIFPGWGKPKSGLLESTISGNILILTDCLSLKGSQLGLGNTKVSRKARQVPVIYPISKSFCLLGFFNHKGVAWLNKTICQFLPTCPRVVVQAGRTLVISCREVRPIKNSSTLWPTAPPCGRHLSIDGAQITTEAVGYCPLRGQPAICSPGCL